jgi:Tfp pilus assembly protein PilF
MQSDRPPGGSLTAYNAFLQGRFYFSRLTAADYHKAIEAFTQAVGLDPSYALAWSELSLSWTWLGSEFLEGAPAQQQAYAKAREAADRALMLSPDLAAAHVARGLLLQNADFDWHGAEAEFRRALQLAPNDGVAKFYLGTQLATFGEVEPAIELTQQALATDPLRAVWYNFLASYLSGLNRLDEAERAVRRAIELQPAAAGFHQMLTIIEVQRGNAQAALDAAREETHRGYRASALAMARQIAGDRKSADVALRMLIDEDANSMTYAIAQVYALRNDPNRTFEWLDRAWSNRDGDIEGLLYDPFILRYKDDPRFAAFRRKVGLLATRRQSS